MWFKGSGFLYDLSSVDSYRIEPNMKTFIVVGRTKGDLPIALFEGNLTDCRNVLFDIVEIFQTEGKLVYICEETN